jgi:molybdenum cofactor cytidylyltransferase
MDVLPARARAVLLLLSDQPDVDVASLRRLVRAWRRRPGHAAAAVYEGKLGAPAILPRPMWARARGLTGDVGARALLRGAGAGITKVTLPEAAFDIDTEKDRARLAGRD